jgi:hypothetical protein
MVRVVPSFIPAFQPAGDVTAHRYIHVIGTTVFVSDRVETDGAPHHFLGFFQGDEHEGIEAVWAVDVPHGEDPSYGAAIDLYTYFGRATRGGVGRRGPRRAARRVGPHPSVLRPLRHADGEVRTTTGR